MSGPRRKTLWRIYAVPLQLAMLTLAGLSIGLFGEGLFDALAWGLLVAVIGRALACACGSRLPQIHESMPVDTSDSGQKTSRNLIDGGKNPANPEPARQPDASQP